MKILKLALLALSLGLLLYGLFLERHAVHSFAGTEPSQVSGPELTEIATRDGLMRKDGKVFDTSTVSQAAGDGLPAQEDDVNCAT